MTDLEIIARALCEIARQLQMSNVAASTTIVNTGGAKVLLAGLKEIKDDVMNYEDLKNDKKNS